MPLQEVQCENVKPTEDNSWKREESKDGEKLVHTTNNEHLTKEHGNEGVKPLSPSQTAVSGAIALHELLGSYARHQSSTDIHAANPEVKSIDCKPPNGTSHQRRSSIGRWLFDTKEKHETHDQIATDENGKTADSTSQGRRSSFDRHLSTDSTQKASQASLDQENWEENEQIAGILCARTNAERLEIARAYRNLYKEDLITELKHKLTGRFGQLIQALMLIPTLYDASQLYQAINTCSTFTGLTTEDSTLIEILCTRSKDEIRQIRNEYRQMYGAYLESDLGKVTWHHLMHLFMWLSVAAREESTTVNRQKARQDAMSLIAADEEHFGRNSLLFSSILSMQSVAQLNSIFDEYKHIAGIDFFDAVEREFEGDFKNALLVIIMTVRNQLPTYYAHRLHKILHGITDNDIRLIRLLVTRSDIDMVEISSEYERIYNKTLQDDISAYCSGSFREGLLQLVDRS